MMATISSGIGSNSTLSNALARFSCIQVSKAQLPIAGISTSEFVVLLVIAAKGPKRLKVPVAWLM